MAMSWMELLFHCNTWMTTSGLDAALHPLDIVFEMFVRTLKEYPH